MLYNNRVLTCLHSTNKAYIFRETLLEYKVTRMLRENYFYESREKVNWEIFIEHIYSSHGEKDNRNLLIAAKE